MSHVFIAYKREDKAFARELRQKLKDANVPTWMDEDILPADKWRDEIDLQLRQSFALVLLLTDQAMESIYVQYEWMFALGMGIQVFPIRVQQLKNPRIYRLEELQETDFYQESEWEKLISKLEHAQSDDTIAQSRYLSKKIDDAINGDNENIRKTAIDDIIKYDDDRIPDMLVDIIEKSRLVDNKVFAAIRLAEKFNDERSIVGLITGIRENNPHRERAIKTIQEFGEKAIDGLIQLLDAEWSEARYQAVRILGDWKVKKVADKFLEMLQTEEPNKVFSQLSVAMYQLEDNRAVPFLIDIVVNRHFSNDQVIKVLADFADERAIPALITTIQRDINKTRYVMEGFKKLGKTTIPYLLKEIDISCTFENEIYLRNMLEIVGNLAYPEFYESVYKFLDCNRRHAHGQAVTALGNIGDPRCIPKIGDLLETTTDSELVWLYLSTLGKINDKDTYPYLLKVLGKYKSDVMNVLKYKLYHSFPEAIETGLKLLEHKDLEIRGRAEDMLRTCENTKAIQALQVWKDKQPTKSDDE